MISSNTMSVRWDPGEGPPAEGVSLSGNLACFSGRLLGGEMVLKEGKCVGFDGLERNGLERNNRFVSKADGLERRQMYGFDRFKGNGLEIK